MQAFRGALAVCGPPEPARGTGGGAAGAQGTAGAIGSPSSRRRATVQAGGTMGWGALQGGPAGRGSGKVEAAHVEGVEQAAGPGRREGGWETGESGRGGEEGRGQGAGGVQEEEEKEEELLQREIQAALLTGGGGGGGGAGGGAAGENLRKWSTSSLAERWSDSFTSSSTCRAAPQARRSAPPLPQARAPVRGWLG
jgi:hypothetical protein